MIDAINKAVSFAQSLAGTKEGKNNYNIFGKFFDENVPDFYNYKKANAPYCQIYVHYVLVKCFGADKVYKMCNLPKKSEGASCIYCYGRYKKAGRLIDKPEKGAQVFFKNKTGGICHTGIITKVNNTHFFTMEGNKPDGLTKECKYPLNSKKVLSFAMPDYSIVSNITDTPVTPSEPVTEPTSDIGMYKVVAPSGLRIREKTNTTTARVLAVMPYESIATAYKYNDKWLKIVNYTNPKGVTRKISGYIYSKWVRRI